MTAAVLEEITSLRLLPALIIRDTASVSAVAEALHAGGLPMVEVMFRTPEAQRALRGLAEISTLTVGAGSVVSPDQVVQARDAGAQFVVSPGMSPAVIARCSEIGLPIIPGVATATEIIAAHDAGLRLLKYFPAEASGGVAALRALAGPFPQVRFVPTGGVTASNMAAYLSLGAVAAVGGSWMLPQRAVEARDVSAMTALVRRAVAAAGGVVAP